MNGYVSEMFVSFQGEGADVGRRHLFVRLAGCNIRCVYCDTPDSLERTDVCRVERRGCDPEILSNPLSVEAVVDRVEGLARSEGPIDAIAITGGEPLVQADFIRAVLDVLDGRFPVLLETNGTLVERLRTVIDQVDIVSMDIKPPTNTGERPFWQAHREFARIASPRRLYVKVLVDDQTEIAEIAQAAEIVCAEAPGCELFLQPVTAHGGRCAVSSENLTAFYMAARDRHLHVRVIPQTHKMIGLL